MICAFLPTSLEAAAEDKGLAAATLRSVQCASSLAENLGKMARLHLQTNLETFQLTPSNVS